ncbi:hypothetical protein [Rhizobium mongolense]|uniref:Uncharacterized protein n=2 Tax=Rhizobium mongolense TaxID=57676 RepID=A0ABR6IVU7_9HYPH|nr:hypothetical protein [Rhizobium mongolense]MBB4232043.1 hypothetical protein [Rhizobium mongolense]TVZ63979.1 hypothetical protein BCL32_4171 [Rhizobium mongolense USDA 1844]
MVFLLGAPAAMVFCPPGERPVALAGEREDPALGTAFVVVTGESPDYVRGLYACGVLMVLRFRKSGWPAYRPA